MLRTLLESNPPRQRRRASTAASIAVHTLAIAGAVAATASARTGDAKPPVQPRDTVIYVAPRERERPADPSPGRAVSQRSVSPIRSLPAITFDARRPPTTGIEIDLGELLRRQAPDSGIGLRGPIGGPLAGDPTAPAGGEPATMATVDRPATMRGQPRPRYPEQLRAAGVTGRVVVRLVVDTAGRVEPASVVVRESSHDLFAQAVRAVIPALRFTPAEAGGRKVRMLVELPFEFRLDP